MQAFELFCQTSAIFCTLFYVFFSTLFLILTDILPSFTKFDAFPYNTHQLGQSTENRQRHSSTKNKKSGISPYTAQFQFLAMLNCAICSTAVSTDNYIH